MSVPHVPVLIVLYLTLTAWFFLALARNIKRDPSVYEIFRPVQAFALALYLNFLVLGFFRWVSANWNGGAGPRFNNGFWQFRSVPANDAQGTFLAFSLVIFLLLGLTLLRSRERTRHVLREFGSSSAGWLTALWPSPYLILGMGLCGSAMIFMIGAKEAPQTNWSPGLGFLQLAFAAAWPARDFIYLQWMQLRRVRRPIITGMLFMIVFYSCIGIVFSALHLFTGASRSIAAIFIPGAAVGIDSEAWAGQQSQWLVSLALVLNQSLLFAWLQRRELQRLADVKPAAVAAAA